MSALRTYAEQTEAERAATLRMQLEMCLPEWEDAETRAADRYLSREESGR